VLLLFAATLFVSSTLLFLVQPMIAKMVLPLLGGTPAVWNTCMVFFQATLLAGYVYAHAATRWLRPRHQGILHLTLLSISLLALPIVVASGDAPPTAGTPVLWLLRVLVFTVGVPFFVVSTSSPLLQRWFARTGHPSARDPYFLYAAGNLGSLIALVSYPALLEPTLRLREQSWVWAVGYTVFVLLVAGCYWTMHLGTAPRRDAGAGTSADHASDDTPVQPLEALTVRQRLRWIALAAAPSSLLLGVTTYLSTDIAAVPLLWVVPLAIYLSTFIFVFARRTIVPHAIMLRALPLLVLPLATLIVFETKLPPAIQIPVHLVTFFVVTMVCHGELARTRPSSGHLTEFYLWMSFGGVIGGLFNALVAPLAFRSVLEYPLAVIVACLLRPRTSETADTRVQQGLDIALPVLLGSAVLGLLWAFRGGNDKNAVSVLAVFIVPAIVCFSFKRRPVRFALSLTALMLAGGSFMSAHEGVAYRGRSFFGVHRVLVNPAWNLRLLVHGGIVHGAQSLDPARRREPLTYYHRTGPIGQVFAALRDRPLHRIGIVGLGTGTLAAYGEPGQRWTYYEIDPAIVRLARDPHYFTFLQDSQASIDVALGDARVSLARSAPQQYDLLVVDAFSSDAIPVHLVTREALRLYATHMAEHGVIAFHLSNRYLDLAPLLSELASDAGLAFRVEEDIHISAAESAEGKSASRWAVMARQTADFGALAQDRRWHTVPQGAASASLLWTDDFSNLLSLFRWYGAAADLQ
jgi:hypothetical protein